MGRIKTRWMKNVSEELVRQYPNKFTADFQNNKKIVEEMKLITDKSVRNKVCGYIAKVISKEQV